MTFFNLGSTYDTNVTFKVLKYPNFSGLCYIYLLILLPQNSFYDSFICCKLMDLMNLQVENGIIATKITPMHFAHICVISWEAYVSTAL